MILRRDALVSHLRRMLSSHIASISSTLVSQDSPTIQPNVLAALECIYGPGATFRSLAQARLFYTATTT